MILPSNFQNANKQDKEWIIKQCLNNHNSNIADDISCSEITLCSRGYGLGGYKINSITLFDDVSRYGYYYAWFEYKNIDYLEHGITNLIKYHEKLEYCLIKNNHKIYQMIENFDENIIIRYDNENMRIYLKIDNKIPIILKDYKWMFDIIKKYLFNNDSIIKHIMEFMI